MTVDRAPGDAIDVFQVTCTGDGQRRPDGFSPTRWWEVCLVRQGCFRYRSRWGEALVDASSAVINDPARDFEVDHPLPGGDRDTFLQVGEQVLASVAGGDLDGLPRVVPTAGPLTLTHHRLVAAAHRDPSSAEVEELALVLLTGLVGHAQPARTAAGRLPAGRRARQILQDARLLLTERSDLSQVQLARRLETSPAHLSRLFARHTGAGVAAYRTSLRVAWVLDRLADGESDLAALAAATGFADHAHMSRTIRARFGSTPSALRAQLAGCRPARDGDR